LITFCFCLQCQRFLRLQPPRESDVFHGRSGDILLQEELKGEIYVKSFWLGNKARDGFYHGLNLHHLHLDRDRKNALSSRHLRKKYAQLWADAINQYDNQVDSIPDRLVNRVALQRKNVVDRMLFQLRHFVALAEAGRNHRDWSGVGEKLDHNGLSAVKVCASFENVVFLFLVFEVCLFVRNYFSLFMEKKLFHVKEELMMNQFVVHYQKSKVKNMFL
jgi:hypothetical protein